MNFRALRLGDFCVHAAIFDHNDRGDFDVRAAISDRTVRCALSPPHTSRAPGFAAQDHARARDSNAAQGNTQDKEATLANL